MAVSMLEVAGRTVIAVDDDYDQAAAAGLPTVPVARALIYR